MYQSILVPVDGSDQSCEALRVAAKLVDADSGSLYAINIQDRPLAEDGMGRAVGLPATNADEVVQREGRAVIEQVCERVGLTNKQVQPIVLSGKSAQLIIDESHRLGVDALVMGSRGNSNIKSLVVGSVSYRVMHVAACAVIIVG